MKLTTITVEMSPELAKRLTNIESMLKKLLNPEERGDEWLTLRRFCQKYDTTESTVRRRVKLGEIESKGREGSSKCYRWKED